MLIWHAVSDIVVVDLIKKEIYDTWKPGTGSETTEVCDIAFGNGKIYAATDMESIQQTSANPGLSYFGNWNLCESYCQIRQENIHLLVFSGNKLYVNLVRSAIRWRSCLCC